MVTYPHLLLNFKLYAGTAGEDGLALARTGERVAAAADRTVAAAPQTPDLRLIAERTALSVGAQSVDAFDPGRGNGRISLEAVAAGADVVGDGTRLLVGGGISTSEDVRRAFELGADVVGASSAFLEADDRRAWLADATAAMAT